MLGAAVIALVALAAISILYAALVLGIGPLPTSRAMREVMLELCPADQQGLVLELGSGWGGLARALARRCPKSQVIGVEASWVPWAFSALVQRLSPLPNLRLVRGDLYRQPLEQADLLVCYLFTGAMRELAEARRFKTGALLVTSTFALPGVAAETTLRARDLYASPVYRYRL